MGWAYGGEDRESISTGVMIQIDLGHVSVLFRRIIQPQAVPANGNNKWVGRLDGS